MIGVGLTLMGGRGTMADISDLDERVRQAAEAWGLVVGDALVGGTMSAVFAATDMAGRDLVLKLPAVRDDAADLTGAEAAALSLWASTGASVTLVDATPDALLQRRAADAAAGLPATVGGRSDDVIALTAAGAGWVATCGLALDSAKEQLPASRIPGTAGRPRRWSSTSRPAATDRSSSTSPTCPRKCATTTRGSTRNF